MTTHNSERTQCALAVSCSTLGKSPASCVRTKNTAGPRTTSTVNKSCPCSTTLKTPFVAHSSSSAGTTNGVIPGKAVQAGLTTMAATSSLVVCEQTQLTKSSVYFEIYRDNNTAINTIRRWELANPAILHRLALNRSQCTFLKTFFHSSFIFAKQI